jgi:tungstate transport system ATP-binding protein
MSLIETVSLCQKFGEREVLKDINLRIDRSEVFAIIGPTGSGKTTLLRLIDLLDEPASGTIYFDGSDVTQSGKMKFQARRRMAFVLQKPTVFNASVYDNAACGLRWRGEGRSNIRHKITGILEMVGLSAEKDRNARTLSGGEVQRVAIARAIATEPELLLLDEPTANLDPVSTSRIEGLVRNIIHQYKTTIIMATHDMSQGQRLANRVGLLLDGEILQTGDWRDVFNYPLNRQVADFVGVENTIDGVIASSKDKVVTIKTDSSILEAISDYPAGDEVCACIRPEDITLSLARTSTSARNSFAGQIKRVVATGPLTRIELDCGFPLVALVTRMSAQELGLEPGRQVFASFKATAIHVIRR